MNHRLRVRTKVYPSCPSDNMVCAYLHLGHYMCFCICILKIAGGVYHSILFHVMCILACSARSSIYYRQYHFWLNPL